MAWLAGYSKRKELTLTGGASGAQTDFQLKIDVSYAAAMQGDFDDLRFTQANGTTLVDAWAQLIVADTSATVWVEFPTTPANTVEQTYYMYYGNAGAASDWDGSATFLFFDDFEDGNTTGWTLAVSGAGPSMSVVTDGGSKVLKVVDSVGANFVAYSDYSFTDGILEAKVKMGDSGIANNIAELVGRSQANNTGGYSNCIYRDSVSPDTRTNKIQRTHLATLSSQSWNFNFGQYYRLKIILNGTSIKTYIDDALELSTTNATYGSGRVGCGGNVVGSAGAYFDDIRVRKYAANPPTYAFGAEESAPTGAAPTSIFYGPLVGPFGGAI